MKIAGAGNTSSWAGHERINAKFWQMVSARRAVDAKRQLQSQDPKIIGDNFFALLKAVETDLTQGIRNILKSQGVDGDSDLIKSVGVTYNQDLFQILANDYYWYVSTGRKPKARKIPIAALVQWIKDKNISYSGSINSAAFAIQTSIYKSGIQGLLYKDAVVDFSLKALSSITPEVLAEMTVVEIVKNFVVLSRGGKGYYEYGVKIKTKNITLG